MDYLKIIKAANILHDSRLNHKKIEKLPDDCNPQSYDEAYAIQDELAKKYLSYNPEISVFGKKVACTNKAAQIQLNVNESFSGNLFSRDVSKSNSTIDSKNFFSPFVEPEFSFIMKNELNISRAPYKVEEIYDSIAAVLPSIELVDSRFQDWTSIGVYSLIADNAVHAHWIYGNKINNLKLFNFNNHAVELTINEKLIEIGNSNNVMGNPINSLTWLINKMAERGRILPKNYHVTTGTCTKAIPINKGDNITADFGSLGKIGFIYK